jgi:hypothetical protein
MPSETQHELPGLRRRFNFASFLEILKEKNALISQQVVAIWKVDL